MLDYRQIIDANNKAARRAKRNKKIPYVPWCAAELETWRSRAPIPYIGDYSPPGWEMVDEVFVDSSGVGSEYELAWTIQHFLDYAKEHLADSYGYAVTSSGEFQVYVGVFRKEEQDENS